MSKRRGQRGRRQPSKKRTAGGIGDGTSTVIHLLEQGTLQDLRAAKDLTRRLVDYSWRYYSELALQRSRIEDELKNALVEAAIVDYPFKNWQRAVRYRYSLHPLCSLGSLKDPGGRFNIGDIDPVRFPQFPALYLASDKDTALQETLGQVPPPEGSPLTAQEIALTSPQSVTIVSVSGSLETVIDLTEPRNLKGFVELIKDFTLSPELKKEAKELGMPEPNVVQTPSELANTLLEADWQKHPMGGDIPANPQLFGHLVFLAGIEGILYPSKLTEKACLAIFPRNFPSTSSFVEMDDAAPDERVPSRLDSDSWKLSETSFEELPIRNPS